MNNKAEAGEDSAEGLIRKAHQLRVPAAESRQRSRFSRVATGLYIARTVSPPGREAAAAVAAAVVGIAGTAVSRRAIP